MLNHHMTRRTFVGSAAALTLALAGCSRGADGKNAPGSTETDSGLAEGGAPADGIAAGDGATMAASGSVLVAYYSATGNTEAVALTIADELGAGTFSITPVEPYTDEDLDYNDSSSRVSVEHDDSARSVELAQVAPDSFDAYTTVFVGYPIWWGEASWVVDGFVLGNDFSGKTVVPFCTSASSGIGGSATALAELAGTGSWQEGMRFSANASADEVVSWLDGLQLA